MPGEVRRPALLITGASSGIGRQMAIQLSRTHTILIHGRDEERLEDTRQQCVNPPLHSLWRFDLADVEGVSASLGAVLGDQVRLFGFVHCAAVLKVLPLRSQSFSGYRENLNVNFLSAVEIVSTLMKKKVNDRQLRSVVFVSSIASRFGAKGFGAYAASKGALDAFMRTMAVELAPEVRLNSVLPGAVRTAMTEQMFTDQNIAMSFHRDYPLGLGEATDIVNATAFLLSDNARWITGQQLVVDGGRTTNITA